MAWDQRLDVISLLHVLLFYCCRAKRAVQDAMRADADDAIDNMSLVDSIYRAAGLPVRQPTSYFLPAGSDEAACLLPKGIKCSGRAALSSK